jgi:aspartyl-tRNA synthetase
VLGISEEEAKQRFGFLLEVMRMGPPPHGGFGFGVDRFLALLAGEPNIREVIAFPKAASGSEPMTAAPTSLPEEQLRELGIRVLE